jgi:hypothetical protein
MNKISLNNETEFLELLTTRRVVDTATTQEQLRNNHRIAHPDKYPCVCVYDWVYDHHYGRNNFETEFVYVEDLYVKIGWFYCIENDGDVDLTIGENYCILKDSRAEQDGLVRVIDNSGGSYLYPKGWFSS